MACRGLEKALDQMEVERAQSQAASKPPSTKVEDAKERDVRRVLMRERRAAAWRHLTTSERDVLTVLTAVCKVPTCSSLFPAPVLDPASRVALGKMLWMATHAESCKHALPSSDALNKPLYPGPKVAWASRDMC